MTVRSNEGRTRNTNAGRGYVSKERVYKYAKIARKSRDPALQTALFFRSQHFLQKVKKQRHSETEQISISTPEKEGEGEGEIDVERKWGSRISRRISAIIFRRSPLQTVSNTDHRSMESGKVLALTPAAPFVGFRLSKPIPFYTKFDDGDGAFRVGLLTSLAMWVYRIFDLSPHCIACNQR
ncbi:hypothetical protein ACLOJK_029001 [Asimina triloba]